MDVRNVFHEIMNIFRMAFQKISLKFHWSFDELKVYSLPDLKESWTTMWKTTWTWARFECRVMKTSPIWRLLLPVDFFVYKVRTNEKWRFKNPIKNSKKTVQTWGSLPSLWWACLHATTSLTSSRSFSSCSSIAGKWNSVVNWQIEHSSGRRIGYIENLEVRSYTHYVKIKTWPLVIPE